MQTFAECLQEGHSAIDITHMHESRACARFHAVRTTVVGLEPSNLDEIELCAAELETILTQYQKVAAK
eukprot:s2206_g7.t1